MLEPLTLPSVIQGQKEAAVPIPPLPFPSEEILTTSLLPNQIEPAATAPRIATTADLTLATEVRERG